MLFKLLLLSASILCHMTMAHTFADVTEYRKAIYQATDGKFVFSIRDLVSLNLESGEVDCCCIYLLLWSAGKRDGGITPLGSPAEAGRPAIWGRCSYLLGRRHQEDAALLKPSSKSLVWLFMSNY